MKIAHKIPKLNLIKEGIDNPVSILSNRIGGFIFLSDPVISKYNGLFVNYNLQPYGIIHNIGLANSKYTEILNHLSHIVRKHKDNSEKIVFPEGINGMIYVLSKKADINIDFDCRKIHDLRGFGRVYRIDVEKDKIFVNFTKHTDGRDDDSEDVDEFKLCVIVQPKGFKKKDYIFVNQWLESYFSYDHGRKDSPSHRYFYRPFVLSAKDVLIAVGRDKQEALAELDKLKKYTQVKKNYAQIDNKKDKSCAAAFVCAQESLDSLKTVHEEIVRLFAGYPWFFQMWSRDENVCLGALIKKKEFSIVKDILFRYLDNISSDGRLPNHIPSPHLGSSDGVGWFWKRLGDFIEAVKADGKETEYLSAKDTDKIKKALTDSIKKIEKNYLKDGLIFSRTKETWMDTVWHAEDGREGFPIEIQALHLNMLKIINGISGEKRFKVRENKMKQKVLEMFWKDGVLADMSDNQIQRPNIFIAYYAYPELLSRRDWQSAFEHCLDKLWLDWGGLASIAKDSQLFSPEYTGKDNQSYHRGDSWYWINNLAALCLYRNNAIKFDRKIKSILRASTEEILWKGAIGHNAEVSSASHMTSDGCFAQAWSVAMFIELVLEVYGDEK